MSLMKMTMRIVNGKGAGMGTGLPWFQLPQRAPPLRGGSGTRLLLSMAPVTFASARFLH